MYLNIPGTVSTPDISLIKFSETSSQKPLIEEKPFVEDKQKEEKQNPFVEGKQKENPFVEGEQNHKQKEEKQKDPFVEDPFVADKQKEEFDRSVLHNDILRNEHMITSLLEKYLKLPVWEISSQCSCVNQKCTCAEVNIGVCCNFRHTFIIPLQEVMSEDLRCPQCKLDFDKIKKNIYFNEQGKCPSNKVDKTKFIIIRINRFGQVVLRCKQNDHKLRIEYNIPIESNEIPQYCPQCIVDDDSHINSNKDFDFDFGALRNYHRRMSYDDFMECEEDEQDNQDEIIRIDEEFNTGDEEFNTGDDQDDCDNDQDDCDNDQDVIICMDEDFNTDDEYEDFDEIQNNKYEDFDEIQNNEIQNDEIQNNEIQNNEIQKFNFNKKYLNIPVVNNAIDVIISKNYEQYLIQKKKAQNEYNRVNN